MMNELMTTGVLPDDALLPSQRRVFDEINALLPNAVSIAVVGRAGTGKSRLAHHLAGYHPGALCLDRDNYSALMAEKPFDRWEDRVMALIEESLAKTDLLIIDDYMFLMQIRAGESGMQLHHFLRALPDVASLQGKRVVTFGRVTWYYFEGQPAGEDMDATSLHYDRQRTHVIGIDTLLQPEDYQSAIDAFMAGADHRIDGTLVYLAASHLSIRQLRLACNMLSDIECPDTNDFIDIVGRFILHDNLALSEVEALSFDELPGSQHIAETLETHVIMPLERPDLARSRGIKAKRGVMLFGPPGTGKTSIGRALAHRMKGQFFLLDGSVGTEPPHIFFRRAKAIIDQAVRSAPSVLFIDDADNLLNIPYVSGLNRYLLSLLDGMESDAASKVCVIMTVMDALRVPEALTRSGRVELWLETATPDHPTRARMLKRWGEKGLPIEPVADYDHLAGLCEGATPADLRRIMNDARLLYARDRVNGTAAQNSTTYIAQAIDELIQMRGRMADTLKDDRLRLATATPGIPK